MISAELYAGCGTNLAPATYWPPSWLSTLPARILNSACRQCAAEATFVAERTDPPQKWDVPLWRETQGQGSPIKFIPRFCGQH